MEESQVEIIQWTDPAHDLLNLVILRDLGGTFCTSRRQRVAGVALEEHSISRSVLLTAVRLVG